MLEKLARKKDRRHGAGGHTQTTRFHAERMTSLLLKE